MLAALALLFACQLVGEFIVGLADLPVPGPVVGMGLLFIGLVIRGQIPASLDRVAGNLLGHLGLLFVPAGVGVIAQGDLIAREWPAMTVALVLSTLATLVVTGRVMRALAPREDHRE